MRRRRRNVHKVLPWIRAAALLFAIGPRRHEERPRHHVDDLGARDLAVAALPRLGHVLRHAHGSITRRLFADALLHALRTLAAVNDPAIEVQALHVEVRRALATP